MVVTTALRFATLTLAATFASVGAYAMEDSMERDTVIVLDEDDTPREVDQRILLPKPRAGSPRSRQANEPTRQRGRNSTGTTTTEQQPSADQTGSERTRRGQSDRADHDRRERRDNPATDDPATENVVRGRGRGERSAEVRQKDDRDERVEARRDKEKKEKKDKEAKEDKGKGKKD
jgi:hypothetical protein